MQITPPITPMITDQKWVVMSGAAVMDTSPAIAPLRPANRSMRPSSGRDTAKPAIAPAAAAKLVLTSTMLIATASAALPSAS